ncbi:unnamed protein product [Effrenium voratum]|nr:unnamed protein product [Effrenium voratum]CAJ1442221.1 unnamed protein product [Effrenium voratum]CAJ1454435.1 unnamed protein product [Effrenium voratum]
MPRSREVQAELEHVDKKASMADILVDLLQVQPQHRVLDVTGACSRQLAEAMHRDALAPVPGLLVANAKPEELPQLVAAVPERLRSPVVFTGCEPQRFPQLKTTSGSGGRRWAPPSGREPTGQFLLNFDRVLCSFKDCSCSDKRLWHQHSFLLRTLQRGLLALAPGGRLVYVTHSAHAVMNEAVVAAALASLGQRKISLSPVGKSQVATSTKGMQSWHVPTPDASACDSHFSSWDAVPRALQGGKILKTMFPPEDGWLKLQLGHCLRLHGQDIFVAVFEKQDSSSISQLWREPGSNVEGLKEDKADALQPGSHVIVKVSGAPATVVGPGQKMYQGLIKIRYPDKSTFHVERADLQSIETKLLVQPSGRLYARRVPAITLVASILVACFAFVRRPGSQRRRPFLFSLVLLALSGWQAHVRRQDVAQRSQKTASPASRLVKRCAKLPLPVQSLCNFLGCPATAAGLFSTSLAYRTADKQQMYVASAALLELRVPEQLRQSQCGMPIFARCISTQELRHWGCELRPTQASPFLGCRRQLCLEGHLFATLLQDSRISLAWVEGVDLNPCRDPAGNLQLGAVILVRCDSSTPACSALVGVLQAAHIEIHLSEQERREMIEDCNGQARER